MCAILLGKHVASLPFVFIHFFTVLCSPLNKGALKTSTLSPFCVLKLFMVFENHILKNMLLEWFTMSLTDIRINLFASFLLLYVFGFRCVTCFFEFIYVSCSSFFPVF